MHILGLVGGIACGKSQVATELKSLGARVLDADRAAHAAINVAEVKEKLVRRWGNQILLETGEVDRKAVAEIVFGKTPKSAAELEFLEQALHPQIRSQFEEEIRQLAEKNTPLVVIDAPLLLEAGWAELCDSIVFIECPREIRWNRAKLRNWTPEEFAAREASQMPIAEKKNSATHLVENSSSLEGLQKQIRSLWEQIQESEQKSS